NPTKRIGCGSLRTDSGDEQPNRCPARRRVDTKIPETIRHWLAAGEPRFYGLVDESQVKGIQDHGTTKVRSNPRGTQWHAAIHEPNACLPVWGPANPTFRHHALRVSGLSDGPTRRAHARGRV